MTEHTYSIRTTRQGRYQIVDETGRPAHLPHAYDTRAEAESVVEGMARRSAEEAECNNERTPYRDAYARLLGEPTMRAHRAAIQEAYTVASQASKRADAHQRAAVRSTGVVTPSGRCVDDIRQSRADDIAEEACELWAEHARLCAEYETALRGEAALRDLPLHLFRSSHRTQED